MNTPGHVAVNLALLGKKGRPELSLPAIAGALTPDTPIYFFYLYQKLSVDLSERAIWSDVYFRPQWQILFDTFHSIPVALAFALFAYRMGGNGWAFFFVSMALHSVFDFPIHSDDAHRHFFPLSDYRFESPISYWDPRRYGMPASLVEIAAVLGAAHIIWRRQNGRMDRAAVITVFIFYAAGFAVVYYYGGHIK
jgi:hypothetical protein